MRVVVMGCGRVGASVADGLSRIGHEVAIIDRDSAAFNRLSPQFAGERVLGQGFDRDVLLRAGIQGADAFAAVSSGDNSNIISARLARETFGVRLLAQAGGVSGLVYSSLPVVTFVVASSAAGLLPAIGFALSMAGLILLWQRGIRQRGCAATVWRRRPHACVHLAPSGWPRS